MIIWNIFHKSLFLLLLSRLRFTQPHSCDYIGYVRHVDDTARSSKNPVITWTGNTPSSHSMRSGIIAYILTVCYCLTD